MTDKTKILAAQKRVFRLAARDHGLSLKAISMDAQVGYSTIQTWASGHAVMGLCGLHSLAGIIPDELLSLLMPEGVQIIHAPDDIDHDELADLAREYGNEWFKARHSNSPAGAEICPDSEKPSLDAKAAALRAVNR